MAEFVLGKDAKIYQGAAEAVLGAMTEMSNVKDVTLNLEAGETDVSTRGNSGWEAKAATLKKCSIEFDMLWKPADPCFTAIKDAFLNSTLVELAALTGARDASGSQGPKGRFAISKFSRKEPLTEAVTVSVTASLNTYDQWVEV